MAIIVVGTATWTTDQTNTDGYIVRAGELTIDAVTGATDINVIFGSGGTGSFDVEDNAKIKWITNDTYKIYMGGTSAQKANDFSNWGVIEHDYRGSTTTKTLFIGVDSSGNQTTDAINTFYDTIEGSTPFDNVLFDSDNVYVQQLSPNTYYRNCQFGQGNEAYASRTYSGKYWWEDCELQGRQYFAGGGVINEVGTITRSIADLHAAYIDGYVRWKRAYLRITDSTSPLTNAIIILTDSTGKYVWSGITGAGGKLTGGRFGLDYLLGCFETQDDFNGVTTISDAETPSKLTVYKSGYVTHTETHDMSSDWGTAGGFIDIALTPISAGGGGVTGRQIAGMV